MTLREALSTVNREELFKELKKINESNPDHLIVKTDVEEPFGNVIEELLSKPSVPAYEFPIQVNELPELHDPTVLDISFRNVNYDPNKKDGSPDTHEQGFAFGYTPWSEIIDTPIENNTNHSLEIILSRILWELTFFGWNEKQVNEKIKKLESDLNESNILNELENNASEWYEV